MDLDGILESLGLYKTNQDQAYMIIKIDKDHV